MALLYNPFLPHFILSIIFIFCPLSAKHWPLMKMPDIERSNPILSKKKYILRSPKYLNHELVKKKIACMFPPVFFPSVSLSKASIEDTFLEIRKKKCSTKVCVLLTKAEDNGVTEWAFVSPQGFILHIESKKGLKKRIKMTHLTLHIKEGVLFWNGKKITHTLKLQPTNGFIVHNGIGYDGDFIVRKYKDTFLCINQVELEDYVKAVLRTESWPGWPLEVNKAFAIACRSYVMFKVLEAQRVLRPYDIKNTNAHQTYRGRHELLVLKTAVDQTRGVVLGFKGKPILAMFDCCCGGVVPGHINDFNFEKAPYLARTYACHYCKQSSLYSWQIVYEHIALEKLFKEYLKKSIQLRDIQVVKKDKAGLVLEVKLKSSKHNETITGKKLYSLLKEVKSFCFDIQKKSNQVVIIGRGFGHHIGLCQWGARQMVRDGWDYKSILHFYYPSTYFMHLI